MLFDHSEPKQETEKKLDELIKDANSSVAVARCDLEKLKNAKYDPSVMLDNTESFEQYNSAIAKLIKTIKEGIEEKNEFKISHNTNDLVVKSGQLAKKIVRLESSKSEKKQDHTLIEHFEMRATDIPTSRETLTTWLSERIIDPKDSKQTTEDLATALRCFIDIKTKESSLDFSKKHKIVAATALLNIIEGKEVQPLNSKQLKALGSKFLGTIIQKFNSVVPRMRHNPKNDNWELVPRQSPDEQPNEMKSTSLGQRVK